MVSELLVKSLGRFVDTDLNNSAQRDQLRKESIKGLVSIDKAALMGRLKGWCLKGWCLQFGLFSCLMWPLTIYEVSITMVKKLERTDQLIYKKWPQVKNRSIGLMCHQ